MKPSASLNAPLAPHQQEFVNAFLNGKAPQGFVLRWPPGFGAMGAAIAAVRAFLENHPKGRVLVLGPKLLADQTAYRLVSSGVRAEVVDRFFFRMLIDATPQGGDVWQEGNAFVLGLDFAKQQDVSTSLCSASWDLIILMGAESVRGARENLVRHVISASNKARILLLAGAGAGELSTFGVSKWEQHTVDAGKLACLPASADALAPTIRTAHLEPAPGEKRIDEALDELLQSLPPDTKSAHLLTDLVKSARSSGYAALEGVLRRIRNEWAHGWTGRKSQDRDDESDLFEVEREWAVDLFSGPLSAVLMERLLDQLESQSTDPKSIYLSGLLKQMSPSQKTCILASYRATLSYLETALTETGAHVYTVHSELSPERTIDELEKFRATDGLLLITAAALRPELDLSFVDSLIIYDLPRANAKLAKILECFDGVHRSKSLEVTVIDRDGKSPII